jgi:cellulose synthase operon protein C
VRKVEESMNRLSRILALFGLTVFLFGAAISSAQSDATRMLLQKARTLENQGRADLAAAVWEQVLLADPDDPEALAGMARHSQQSGNDEAARNYLDHLRKVSAGVATHAPDVPAPLDPQQKAKLAQADRLAVQHHPDDAMRLYRDVFGDHPPDGDWAIAYYQNLASTTGGTAPAIAGLRDLTRRFPGDPRYAVALGQLLTYNPRTREEGVKLLSSVHGEAASEGSARLAWRQALLWEHGNPAYGSSLREFLSRYPDPDLEKSFGPVRLEESPAEIQSGRDEMAGYQALRSGNIAEAGEIFEKLRAQSPDNPRALEGFGFVRMKQEDFAGAEELFEAAKTHSPQTDKALDEALETARFWLSMKDATASLDQDHLDQALTGFQQALAIRPDSSDALAGVAGTLMKQREPAKAAIVYRKWTQVSSNDSKAWQGLLRSLQQSGDSAGTISAAQSMPATIRMSCLDDPECLVPLAAAYGATGNASESHRLLEHAIQTSAQGTSSLATQVQVASLLSQAGYASEATGMFARLAAQNPDDLDIWRGLISALHESKDDSRALAAEARMPKDVFEKALNNTDFLTLTAAVYQSQGQLDQSHRFLERALQNESANGGSAPADLQLQVAGLWVEEQQYDKAIALYQQVINQHPEDLDSWRGELTALHGAHRDDDVIALVDNAPDAQRRRLESDPDVLGVVAMAHSSRGDRQLALQILRQAAWQYRQAQKPIPVGLAIQSCWILLDANDDAALYSQLQSLAARTDLGKSDRTNTQQLWSAWSIKRAGAAMSAGNSRQALTILSAASRAFPQDLKIRSAFASSLLQAGYPQQAFDEYRRWGLIGGDSDDYQGGIGAAIAARDYKTGQAWLAIALNQWKNDPKLLMMGAKLAVAQGDYAGANRYYRAALASTPQQQDGVMAPGSGMSAANIDKSYAIQNLAQVLAPTPIGGSGGSGSSLGGQDDPLDTLLAGLPPPRADSSNLAGETNAYAPPDFLPSAGARAGSSNAAGDEDPLSIPVADQSQSPSATRQQDPAMPSASPSSARSRKNRGTDSLSWLDGDSDPAQPDPRSAPPVGQDSDFVPPATPQRVPTGGEAFLDPATSAAPPAAAADAGFDPSDPPAPIGVPVSPGAVPPVAAPPSPRAEVEKEIADMGAELSPYVGATPVITARSGQAGLDRLVTQESDLEASTTLDNSVRLTMIAKPTFLDAGASNELATIPLGTLQVGQLFGPMGATGIGAEMQVTTQNFAARLGVTPLGFPVENLTGAVQFRPAGGPIQITVSRDPIRDTLLSFAGVRDPGTGQVWGGVMADGVSGLGSWGSAASGFYTGLGYQDITGRGVADNHRVDGTVGSYWKVWTQPSGSLTIGLNLSGMHYDKNLRYFTIGQGGYFSPQSYFLFNVPVTWKGTYRRFQYSVVASLGSQYFQEDSTPYFPLALLNRHYYPSQISTGANYSLDMKGAYRLGDNWVLGGFIDFNNTLNYASQTVGFYVRYQEHPYTTGSELSGRDLPDWNAMRPLVLP